MRQGSPRSAQCIKYVLPLLSNTLSHPHHAPLLLPHRFVLLRHNRAEIDTSDLWFRGGEPLGGVEGWRQGGNVLEERDLEDADVLRSIVGVGSGKKGYGRGERVVGVELAGDGVIEDSGYLDTREQMGVSGTVKENHSEQGATPYTHGPVKSCEIVRAGAVVVAGPVAGRAGTAGGGGASVHLLLGVPRWRVRAGMR
jgi:hypothetical protein